MMLDLRSNVVCCGRTDLLQLGLDALSTGLGDGLSVFVLKQQSCLLAHRT